MKESKLINIAERLKAASPKESGKYCAMIVKEKAKYFKNPKRG